MRPSSLTVRDDRARLDVGHARGHAHEVAQALIAAADAPSARPARAPSAGGQGLVVGRPADRPACAAPPRRARAPTTVEALDALRSAATVSAMPGAQPVVLAARAVMLAKLITATAGAAAAGARAGAPPRADARRGRGTARACVWWRWSRSLASMRRSTRCSSAAPLLVAAPPAAAARRGGSRRSPRPRCRPGRAGAPASSS